MTNEESFTATHHALLFAWIAREVIQRVGEGSGAAVIGTWVRRYGNERGRRMALRAQANGHPLTVENYFRYGEWSVGEGEMEQRLLEKSPRVTIHALKCPWFSAWKGSGLVIYGWLYCQGIDRALVEGFNPDLRIDVTRTLSNGGKECEFIFYDANLKEGPPEKKNVMPWSYHIGHLYGTACQILTEACGKAGEEAISAAMEEFTRRFGEKAARRVIAESQRDFTKDIYSRIGC